MTKPTLGAAAMVLTFALFYPYVRSILTGATRPHVLSWVIWSLGTFTVFFAQLADGAGVGAWPIGLSALITSYVALVSWLRRSDLSITTFDWTCLLLALLSIPLWLSTSNPLWAVIILTAIDIAGFGPTLRKAHDKPHEERAWFFALGALRNALVITALERYSAATVTFPAAVGVACLCVAIYILVRRQGVSPSHDRRAT
jgi:hypothetical protein